MAPHRPSAIVGSLARAVLTAAIAAKAGLAQGADASAPPSSASNSASATTTSDYYSALNDLTTPGPSKAIGGQNFTRCCLSAVSDWKKGESDVTVQWGDFSKNPNLVFTPNNLSSSGAQFPCGAAFSGDTNGAPEVRVTYSWCASNCGGWQQSDSSDLAEWVIPFVGFILPAAVFCLNVPRRLIFDLTFENPFPISTLSFGQAWSALWSYTASDKDREGKRSFLEWLRRCWVAFATSDFREGWYLLFHYTFDKSQKGKRTFRGWLARLVAAIISTICSLCIMAVRAAVALSLGLANVIGWVVIVFSTAAPMILSGLYEAALDRQVLDAIDREIRHHIEDPEGHAGHDGQGGLTTQEDQRKSTNISYSLPDAERIKYHIHLLYAILVGNLELWKRDPEHPEPAPKHSSEMPIPNAEAWENVQELVEGLDTKDLAQMMNTKTRLQTMLQCQASFGATVGAPIAFFVGAFLLSVESNATQYGDNDDSHTLAFGEWWMTIPHVAIVSGCLLAGNNPNTLEAIYTGIKTVFNPDKDLELRKGMTRTTTMQSTDNGTSRKGSKANGDEDHLNGSLRRRPSEQQVPLARTRALDYLRNTFLSPFYDSWYQPVWMWERGRSKRNWIEAVQNARVADKRNELRPEPGSKGYVSRLRHLWDLSQIRHKCKDIPSLGLIGWVMLILTACILIIIPWVLAYITSYFTPTVGLSCRTFTYVLYFVCQLWLSILWLLDFPRHIHRDLFVKGNSAWPSVFFLAICLGFAGSAFCAVAGTFMQVLGVFRNCKCTVPISSWGLDGFTFAVSSNSAAMIYYAERYWLGTGVASIALLLLFCYFGWWYQRHWRQRFGYVLGEVLQIEQLAMMMAAEGGRSRGSAPVGGGGGAGNVPAESKIMTAPVIQTDEVRPEREDEIAPVKQEEPGNGADKA